MDNYKLKIFFGSLILVLNIYAGQCARKTTKRPAADDDYDSDASDFCDSPEAIFSEKQVLDYVMKDYSPIARPRRLAGETVNVKVALSINAITDFNEKSNLISFAASIKIYWHDNFLVWENDDVYYCCDFLLIPAERIWIPQIEVTNSPDRGRDILNPKKWVAWVYNNGDIYMTTFGILTVMCDVDIALYPYDKQKCDIEITSENYNISKVELSFVDANTTWYYGKEEDAFDTDDWTDNPLWQLDGVVYGENIERDNGLMYNKLTYELYLKRKSLYYDINLLMPSIILTLTVFVNFVLPIHDTGKLDVGFTALLTYTFYQMIIFRDIPKSSDDVPIMSIYIILQRVYIAVIIIFGQGLVFWILTKAKACEEDKYLPPSERMFRAFELMGKVLLVRHILKYTTAVTNKNNKDEKKEGISNDNEGKPKEAETSLTELASTAKQAESDSVIPDSTRTVILDDEPTKDLAKVDQASSKQTSTAKVDICGADKWTYIAMVTDRFTFILYLLVTIITPIVITQYPIAANDARVEQFSRSS